MSKYSQATLVVAVALFAGCASVKVTPLVNEVDMQVETGVMRSGIISACDTYAQVKSVAEVHKHEGMQAGLDLFKQLGETLNKNKQPVCGLGRGTFVVAEALDTYLLDWGRETLTPSVIVKVFIFPHRTPFYGMLYKASPKARKVAI